MFKALRMLSEILIIFVMCSFSFGAAIVVKQAGGGKFTTIQSALSAAKSGDSVEVQDNATYIENISFNADSVTLTAANRMKPVITLSGKPKTNSYITLSGKFTTIDGFIINFKGIPASQEHYMIVGGAAAKLKNCVIDGKSCGVRGVGNISSMENVEIKNCIQGIIYDVPITSTITNCNIHNNSGDNDFTNGNITFTNCTLNGSPRNIITNPSSDAVLTFNNCTIKGASERNVILQGSGPVTFTNSTIMDAAIDNVLINAGVVHFNRCILQTPDRDDPYQEGACINSSPNGVNKNPVTITIDNCDIIGNMNPSGIQYTVFSIDPLATITMKKSIVTGNTGIKEDLGAKFISEYNNVYAPPGRPTYKSTMPIPKNDININIQYANIIDPSKPDYFQYKEEANIKKLNKKVGIIGSRGPIGSKVSIDKGKPTPSTPKSKKYIRFKKIINPLKWFK